MQKSSHASDRYYHADPQTITLETCEAHGKAHKAYGWCAQIDPRWSDAHKEAYLRGFAGSEVGGGALGTRLWAIVQQVGAGR